MKKNVWIFALLSTVVGASAQDASPTPSASASAADVEALRQQVKDQQAAIEKANPVAEQAPPQNPEPSPIAAATGSPTPAAGAPARFPTEDTSVVSSTTAAPSGPGVTADGTGLPGAFPTTDSSVVTSTSDTSIFSGGSSLTAPIGISSGKNYM